MPDNKPNDNDFGQRLGRIVLSRLKRSEKLFNDTVERVKRNVKKSIEFKDEEYEQIYESSKELLEECENYAEIYVAAKYLYHYIFNEKEGSDFKKKKECKKVKENINFETRFSSKWGKDHHKFPEAIKDSFEKDDLIYIFWSLKSKVKYFYVGLTHNGHRRFGKNKHYNASVCATKAERFTIIYLSSKSYLEVVEACIIRVFGLKPEIESQEKFGIGPEYENLKDNEKYEKFLRKDESSKNKTTSLIVKLNGCDYELYKNYTNLKAFLNKFNTLKKKYHKKNSELSKILSGLRNLEDQIYQI
jgi:hypothetical protein